ncbi:MAG: serine hydrolase domain-containing protein [Acidobacteriota bacterium]|nr:beta-lactamase family protein [Blastocatellia bacterium]MDW8413337.1 serine hydrolase domain-containing protein [Acidobacteriota bacterium]
MKELQAFIEQAIAEEKFPSAAYLIAEGESIIASGAAGKSLLPCSFAPQGYDANIDTIYDLASLTKPLFTGYLLLQALQQGMLQLDTTLATVLEEFANSSKADITLKQLATHSSGLAAWLPLYVLAGCKENILATLVNTNLAYSPGTKVVYSDLGYIILGLLLERIYGCSLETLLAEMRLQLGLQNTYFNPPSELRPRIAASEFGNYYEQQMAAVSREVYNGWRTDLIWGSVHDHNCFFLGGASGHAGLFADITDVYKMSLEFTASSKTLSEDSLRLAQTDLTEAHPEGRSVGWLMARNQPQAEALEKNSFGHTGFTGTSVWIEPRRSRIYILLTNRMHPSRKEFNMNDLRKQFHVLAAKL